MPMAPMTRARMRKTTTGKTKANSTRVAPRRGRRFNFMSRLLMRRGCLWCPGRSRLRERGGRAHQGGARDGERLRDAREAGDGGERVADRDHDVIADRVGPRRPGGGQVAG